MLTICRRSGDAPERNASERKKEERVREKEREKKDKNNLQVPHTYITDIFMGTQQVSSGTSFTCKSQKWNKSIESYRRERTRFLRRFVDFNPILFERSDVD